MTIKEYSDITVCWSERRFGLYQDGALVDDGLLHREKMDGTLRRVYAPAPWSEPVELAGCGLFMGYLSAHYGHFLLESLCRAWASERHPDLPLVWVLLHPQISGELTKWQRAVFEFYGLLDRVQLVRASTRFERLLVPEEGYRIKYHFASEHAVFLGKYPGVDPLPGKKVWVSRSGLKKRNVNNEEAVEAALEARGWTIVHPQKLKWTDQLRVLADCEHLAGFAGSALHTIVALGGFRGAVHLFPLGEGFNHNFQIIADVKGLRQTMYEVEIASSGAEYQQESFACAAPELIVDLLSKNT